MWGDGQPRPSSPDHCEWRDFGDAVSNECYKKVSLKLKRHLWIEVLSLINKYHDASSKGLEVPTNDMMVYTRSCINDLPAPGPSVIHQMPTCVDFTPPAPALPLVTAPPAVIVPPPAPPASPSIEKQLMDLRNALLGQGRLASSGRSSPAMFGDLNLSSSSLPSISALYADPLLGRSPGRISSSSSSTTTTHNQ